MTLETASDGKKASGSTTSSERVQEDLESIDQRDLEDYLLLV